MPDTPSGGILRQNAEEPSSCRRESFDRMRAEDQADPVFVAGEDGSILYANPAAAGITGQRADELPGRSLLAFITGGSREQVRRFLAGSDDTCEGALSEIQILSKDGLVRSVIVRGKPVLFADRRAALLFLIDITGRKRLEEELAARADELQRTSAALQQANNQLKLLSTITRHDINNQLTALSGFLSLMEPGLSDPRLAEYCRKAQAAAGRIAGMIRFSREYERIGTQAPCWQEMREVVSAAAGDAPLGTVRVINDLPAGWEVSADPLITRVMYNLMDNAVRYGGKITAIRFFLRESGAARVMYCEDDGNGVAADEKERIFERGFGKNTGLGLAISHEILAITGITITETGSPGEGARFEITVPEGAWRMNVRDP